MTGLWVLFSLLLALCASCLLCSLLYFVLLLWSLRRSAPLVLFGGFEGRPSFPPPRTSCLGSPSPPRVWQGPISSSQAAELWGALLVQFTLVRLMTMEKDLGNKKHKSPCTYIVLNSQDVGK